MQVIQRDFAAKYTVFNPFLGGDLSPSRRTSGSHCLISLPQGLEN